MNVRSSLPFILLSCLSSVVSAATVVTSVGPIVLTSGVPVNINLNPGVDAVDDVVFYTQDFGGVALLNASGLPGNAVAVTDPPPNDVLAQRLGIGDSVGVGLDFGGNTSAPPSLATELGFSSNGEWGGGQTGYLGVRFDSAGATHYGFVRVTWVPDNDAGAFGSVAIIDQIGFNDVAGDPAIIVIPEPATTAFLAILGFAGLARRKR